jgi:UDP-3-O-[3-hydroxymyristoyl] glucosamine N-acyltransferase
MLLSHIAQLVNGEIEGDTRLDIERLSKIEDAEAGDVTFYANPKYEKFLSSTSASAVLVSKSADMKALSNRNTRLTFVKVEDPYRAFLKLVEVFYPAPAPMPKGIHPSAVVARSAIVGKDVAIGPNVVVGEKCAIGNGVTLNANVVVGDNVTIGDSTVLYANVTVREQCKIGKRCIVHSGAVVGSDGFGFVPNPDGTYEKIPQRGIVVIEDDVEIGANCTIDRATIGETKIGRGVKLDNLIQVAHNVVVGEHTVIAAQTGISGSTKIGKNCIIAGQVGFVGHITIADRTKIGAQSGIPKSIGDPGKTYFGYPAKEHLHALRIEGAIRQLPELLVEIREMKKRITELEARLKESEPIDK